ncbi:MAG: hypothetical protein FJ125_05965, partial [Deltaproteobacteria bacterium]|nr:hypothetical protein [Deltaproteobacteria bacterium]
MHLGRLARAVSMVVRRKTNIASLLAIGWLAAGWLAVGCADEPAGPGGGVPRPRDAGGGQGRLDGGEQDCARADGGARTADGQLADAADGEGPARRDFREPCSSGNECLSGYCIDDGEGGKLCTRPCNDDCPVDWDCRQLIAEGPDTAFLCFPIRLLCKPCRSSEECGGGENQCLAIGNGTFCSRACPAEDCPRGYACRLPRAEEGEASVPQCLPESGWCTLCRDEDRDGLFGGAGCTEAADCDDNDPDVHRGATERCDGKDNDCDAVTDEEFDLAGDPRNCGSCDRVCSFPHGVPGCRQGECVLLGCVRGWHICDARPERGCEYECQPTHGGVEQCDGLDNDCDCFTDEDFDLQRDPHHCGRCGRVCPVASCAADGRGGFVAASESLCDEGRCTEQEHLPCGLYTCFLGGAEGNRCANSCDDDRRCVAAAHCAAGECMEDLPDGSPCLEDRQCASGHCANGFCCRLGDCCATDLDCPPELYALPPRCHMPSACQGSREDAVCGPESSCLSMLVDDDSACTEETVADECGLFVPLRCRGEQVQQDLPCPQRCAVDEECDPEAHCDGICLEDREDGEGCDEDSDCAGGRCANGFCCADGDCCADEEDCPPGYGSPPVCITPRTCQGSRRDALCSEEHSCFTLVVDDDSACDARLVADGCGLYADQYCRGLVAQWVPLCDEECADDGHCDAAAHCDESECVADLDDGADCDEDSDCASGHCGNGHCCRSGDCCSEAADCPAAYIAAPRCDVAAACQGSRRDAVCDGEHRCGTQRVDDDSACNEEVVADECGLYAS